MRYKQSESLIKKIEKTDPNGRSINSSAIKIIPFASKEGAPMKTATFTGNLGFRVYDSLKKSKVLNGLNISFSNPVSSQNPRSEGDGKNEIENEHQIRNWQNVYEVYKKHYIEVAASIFEGKIPMGIGGDHSMGASTVRASIFAKGLLELLNQSTGILSQEEVIILNQRKENFLKEKSEENLKELAVTFDDILDKNKTAKKAFESFTKEFGVVWFDAHGDINTPMDKGYNEQNGATVEFDQNGKLINFLSPSTSGNFHGMPVATALGFGPKPMLEFGSKHANLNSDNIIFIACRDLDKIEEDAILKLKKNGSGLHMISMKELEENGMITYRNSVSKFKHTIIEHDIDGGNAPRYMATGTPVGDLSFRNQQTGPSHYVIRQAVRNLLLDFPNIVAVDIAEGAALNNENEEISESNRVAANETMHSTMQIVSSVLGLNTEQKDEVFPRLFNFRDSKEHQKIKKDETKLMNNSKEESIPLISR